MRLVSFRVHPTPHADFQDLRKTLILLHGVHAAEILVDRIDVTCDVGETDMGHLRALIEHKGFAIDSDRMEPESP
jgi:hypothetical protein